MIRDGFDEILEEVLDEVRDPRKSAPRPCRAPTPTSQPRRRWRRPARELAADGRRGDMPCTPERTAPASPMPGSASLGR